MARSAGSGRKQPGSNAKKVRARRDFDALRRRRMQAADMFGRGKRQVDVAEKLGVSQPAASRWYQLWLTGGRTALVGAGRAGRRPKLSDEQLAAVEAALVKGPRANGFPTEMWTLARVAEVIERVTGVRLGTTQTWATLRERMGWSVQRPARRAKERNDEAITTWVKEDWPRIQLQLRAPHRQRGHLVGLAAGLLILAEPQ